MNLFFESVVEILENDSNNRSKAINICWALVRKFNMNFKAAINFGWALVKTPINYDDIFSFFVSLIEKFRECFTNTIIDLCYQKKNDNEATWYVSDISSLFINKYGNLSFEKVTENGLLPRQAKIEGLQEIKICKF